MFSDALSKEASALIQKLSDSGNLSDKEFKKLLECDSCDTTLFRAADAMRRKACGDTVYLRGLIEVTNYCKNNCYYCGIRRDNLKIQRYRLEKADILSCCEKGERLGYSTFVLQGGEDLYYTDDILCDIVSEIRSRFPRHAITLSFGERTRKSYQALFDAGANRYLLRHETADATHYGMLHPDTMSFQNRIRCLYDLKEIGYQVGAGFMAGSPYQSLECLIRDLRFLQELSPDMIGMGPYLTHKDTPFASFENGSLSLTLRLLAILRLMFPYAMIPATTALCTLHPKGREMGLRAGANVVMPNLTPSSVRHLYALYENKRCIEDASRLTSC